MPGMEETAISPMSASGHVRAPGKDAAAAGRFRVVSPAVLLALEAAALTPFVEFARGPMAYLASGRVCAALLVALTALCLLMKQSQRSPLYRDKSPRADRLWALLHLAALGVFVLLTLRLQRAEADGTGISEAALWAVLALAVTVTAFLACNGVTPDGSKPRLPVSWGFAALVLGGAFALTVPPVQACWPSVCGPAMVIDRELTAPDLRRGAERSGAAGYPIIGTRRARLLVTPQCSEIEAILAFWLLCGAALATRLADVRPWRAAVVAVVGAAFLYVLNAVRIYGLVVVANQVSPEMCVRLAHSRVSQLAFLILTALLATGPVPRYVLAAQARADSGDHAQV